MYYAACCCEGGSDPVCFCGEFGYASVSWSVASRASGPNGLEISPDRVCSRGAAESDFEDRLQYTEGKVFMKCASGSGTRYETASIPPGLQPFDPSSVVVLEVDRVIRFDIFRVPEILDCCDPPNLFCGTPPGTYVQIDSHDGSLLPFDPLDVFQNQPSAMKFSPTASTFVTRGDQLSIPSEFRDRINPSRYYRKTTVECSWSLMMRRFFYRFDPFAIDEPQEESGFEDVLSGGAFGGVNVHKVTKVADVGEECDAHAIGEDVVTYGGSGSGSEFPFSSVFTFDQDLTYGPVTYFPGCCEDGREFGPTTGSLNVFSIQELDGGTFSLEFTDEPPPELP